MADPKKEVMEQETGLFNRILRFLEKQAEVVAVAGPLGYVSYLVLKSKHQEELFTQFMELGENLKIELKEQFNELKGALIAALLVVVVMILGVVHMATVMEHGHIKGDFWHSRVPVLFIAILVMTLLAVQFASKWIIPFLGLDVFERFVKKDKFHGEGISIKALRFVTKGQGWIFFGLLPTIGPPFWQQPILLWLGFIWTPNYIYFTNSWRKGQSENVRRSILWLTALWQLNCITLASIPGAYGHLMVLFTQPTTWSYTILIIFFIEIAFGIFMGNRQTKEDDGRERVQPVIAASQLIEDSGQTSAQLEFAAKMIGHQPNRDPNTTSSSGGAYPTDDYESGRRSRRMPQIVPALFIGGLVAMGLFGLDKYNSYTATTHNSPMIPSAWIENGGHWPVLLTLGGILLVVAAIGFVLSMWPGRR